MESTTFPCFSQCYTANPWQRKNLSFHFLTPIILELLVDSLGPHSPGNMSGQDLISVGFHLSLYPQHIHSMNLFPKASSFPPSPLWNEKRHSSSATLLSITKDSGELLLQHFYSMNTWIFHCGTLSSLPASCCLRKGAAEGLPRYLEKTNLVKVNQCHWCL